jgi:hypothetical protein
MATDEQRPTDLRRLAEVAARYADHGWPVLPLHTVHASSGCSCRDRDCGSPGKHPRTRRGLLNATTDPDQVRQWWSRWPTANIGVATGTAAGLLVVDVDLPHGPASLVRLEAQHGPLPPTCEQRTGSGGRQLLFAHPGGQVGNRTALEPGIDVRGDGGYVVVPPSLHATGERYRWVGRLPPAEPPAWLVAHIDRTRVRPRSGMADSRAAAAANPPRDQSHHGLRRYAAAALQQELSTLAAAVEGTRNATLNRAAFSLGQLVAVGVLDREHVTAELERVAEGIGLGPSEARRTIASGLTAGLEQPRHLPPPMRAPSATSMTPLVRHIGARRR